MSKIPIINKKYIFLQNIFYNSIQFKRFAHATSSAKNKVKYSYATASILNKPLPKSISFTNPKKLGKNDGSLFKTKKQKYSFLLLNNPNNINFFNLAQPQRVGKKENICLQNQKGGARAKNLLTESLYQNPSHAKFNNGSINTSLFSSKNRKIFSQSNFQTKDIENIENNSKELKKLPIAVTKFSLFLQVSRKNQIQNLFKNGNFSTSQTQPVGLGLGSLQAGPWQKIKFVNHNLSYKKSVICYWLLPFMGGALVTCVPTVIDYVSLSQPLGVAQTSKFVKFNQNFLNNLYLPVNIKTMNQFDSAKLNSNSIEKINKLRMDYKQKETHFLANPLQGSGKDSNEGFSKFGTEKIGNINFDPLKKHYFKLYKLYSDDLEKTLKLGQPFTIGQESNNLINNASLTNFDSSNGLDSFKHSYIQNHFLENIKSFKIYKSYLDNLINQATLKSIWLNSFLNFHSKASFFYYQPQKVEQAFTNKKENLSINKLHFLNKNSNILLSERLEKDTYSILDNINFNQSPVNLRGFGNWIQASTSLAQTNSASCQTQAIGLGLQRAGGGPFKASRVGKTPNSFSKNILTHGPAYEGRGRSPFWPCQAQRIGQGGALFGFGKKVGFGKTTYWVCKGWVWQDFKGWQNLYFKNVPPKLIAIRNKNLQSFATAPPKGIGQATNLKKSLVAPLAKAQEVIKLEKFSKIVNNKVSKSQFFLDLKEKNFLPSTVSNKEQFYKNPILSYQLASSLMDRFDKINFSKKFFILQSSISGQSNSTQKIELGKVLGVGKENRRFDFPKNVILNDLNFKNHNKFLSSISIFSNQQFNEHYLNQDLACNNFIIQDPILDVTQNKEKNHSFLEKTIIFLLTKRIQNVKPTLEVFPTSAQKAGFASTRIDNNVDGRSSINSNSKKSLRRKKKLNKESLYYLTLNALNNSLTTIKKDKNTYSENQFDAKQAQPFGGGPRLARPKGGGPDNNLFGKTLGQGRGKQNLEKKTNLNAASFIQSFENKILKQLSKQAILNSCKIKLSHPILMVNVKNDLLFATKINKKIRNKTVDKPFISQEKHNLNKPLNDSTKNQVLLNQRFALFDQKNPSNLITTLKSNQFDFVEKIFINREKVFLNDNQKRVGNQYLVKDNSYSYFSKYLKILSKKIKKVWLKPIQHSTLEDHFSFKNSKNKYMLLNQVGSTVRPKLINGRVLNLGKRALPNQRVGFTIARKANSTGYQPQGVGQELWQNLEFGEKLNKNQTRKFINLKRIDYTNIPSKRNLVTYKKENFFLLSTPGLNKFNPFIRIPVKNFHKAELPIQRKSQILRLEKIFRSYLSKKFALPTQAYGLGWARLKSQQKRNLNLKSKKFSIWQSWQNSPDGLALGETTITKSFSLKMSQKLKVKDMNLLNLESKKIHIKLKNNASLTQGKGLDWQKMLNKPTSRAGSWVRINSNSGNFLIQKDSVSPSLLFNNRLVIKKTTNKKLTKKQKIFAKTAKQNQPFGKGPKGLDEALISNKGVINKNSSWDSEKLPNSTQKSWDGSTNKYLSLLEKKKYNKKKRRKKKQRKETRRRKKRKRFYPRPIWLRFKFYNKFLKVRRAIIFNDLRNSKNTLILNSKPSNFAKNRTSEISLHAMDPTLSLAKPSFLGRVCLGKHLKSLLLREKICRNYSQNWEKSSFSFKNQPSKEQIKRLYGIPTGLTCLDSTYLPFFTDKDFYYISRTVLGDLKRLFWKSNWLRANLNPYLTRVKTYLNDIKQVNNSWHLYLNIKKLNDEILSFNHSFREVPKNQSTLVQPNDFYLNNSLTHLQEILPRPRNFSYQPFKPCQTLKAKSLEGLLGQTSNEYINIKNYLQTSYFSSDSMKWQVIINMAEYRRILYERIQQIILNIRENLNLSGQVKARSSKIGRKRLQAPKPVKDFWIKFGKTLTFEIPNNFPINFYGNFSKLRLYWAINKSNLGSFKEFNQRNELWISQKLREQSKTNKTKKIIFQMNNSFNDFLDQKSISALAQPLKVGVFDSANSLGLGKHFENYENELLIKSLLNKGGSVFNKFLLNKTELNFIKAVPNVLGDNLVFNHFDAHTSNPNGLGQYSNFIKNWLESSNVTTLEKLKRSFHLTEQKLRKKEKKLSYLGFLTKKMDKLTLQKNYLLRSTNLKGGGPGKERHLRKDLQQRPRPIIKNLGLSSTNITLNSMNSNSFNKFTNNINYWYSYTITPQINMLPLFKNPLNYLNTNSWILWMSTFFFHFCVLLSVISFAEIRGLIKFHIILISKLFKIYLDIIFAVYKTFYNTMPNFLYTNLGEFQTFAQPANSLGLGKKGVGTAYKANKAALSKNWLDSANKKQTKNFYKIGENKVLTHFLMQLLFPLWAKRNFELSQLKNKYSRQLIDKTEIFLNRKKINLKSNRQSFVTQNLDEKRNSNLELNKLSLAYQTFQLFKEFKPLSPSLEMKKEFLDFIKDNVIDKYSWSFYLNFQIFGQLKNQNKISNNLIASQLSFKAFALSKTTQRPDQAQPGRGGPGLFGFGKTQRVDNKMTFDFALIYFSLINSIIKSIFILKLNSNKLINKVSSSSSKSNFMSNDYDLTNYRTNPKELSKYGKMEGITLKVYDSFKIIILSFLTLILSFSYKGSFYFYTSIIKSLDIFKFMLSSIYSFFEKPGELMVDWISYAFLVEWSSDLTTTIPDTVDVATMNSFIKTSRIIQPIFLSQYFLNFCQPQGVGLGVLTLAPNLMQRRIWNSYQLFIEQFFQPDSDLIIRQKKGLIFWDLWSELLIEIAETSNINISELSSLKEEQNRLLDKLEIYAYEKQHISSQPQRVGQETGPVLKQHKLNLSKNLKGKIFSIFTSQFNNSESFGGWLKTQPGELNLARDRVGAKNNHFVNEKSFTFKKQNDNHILHNLSFLNNGLVNRSIARKKENECQTDILWSVNQFLSYQGKDTELFIDLHPPKSFGQLPSIKYSQSIQQPLGTIICQIFSGIFSKQISKNILVIGSEGSEKSLLIQALAGETELKIITDNANRYAMIYRGVAIGIKLLRDVFEALSLHTPCIFLLEDIHYIGERRPFLISDDDTTKGNDFGSEKEEMHEKNQVIYQLSKHVVSHYKKPYKGDFSLLIPTNHFCFNLFLGLSSQKLRNSFITTTSPLNLNKIGTDSNQTYSSSSKKNSSPSLTEDNISNGEITTLSSSLQIQKNQLLAPPATSPFSVLLLKEEKKLKPKQVVKEMPWSGLPGEQLALIAKSNYSTRVKIALLADMALSNVSVKLDIITDLLVIIDSVKGNRGFIVFATTHVPYILDPALRRPGRFDETIGLPIVPNLFSRWEILKANLLLGNQFLVNSFFPKGSTIDFSTISGVFNSNYPLGKFNDKFIHFNNEALHKELVLYKQTFNKKKHKSPTITYHLSRKEDFIINPFKIKQYSQKTVFAQTQEVGVPKAVVKTIKDYTNKNQEILIKNSKKIRYFSVEPQFGYKENANVTVQRSKTLVNVIARTYFYVSKILMNLLLNQSVVSQSNLSIEFRKKQMKQNFMSPIDLMPFENNVYLSLYASTKTLKRHFIQLIAGKLGELLGTSALGFSNSQTRYSISMLNPNSSKINSSKSNLTGSTWQESSPSQDGSESSFYPPQGRGPGQVKNLLNLDGNKGLTSLYGRGCDKTWRSVSTLLFSMISKRYLLNRNLMTPKLLSFSNVSSFYESPSPPTSTILLPLKRYENYKRTFSIEQIKHKANFQFKNLQNTLELHQNQRLVKRLYKLPIREFFRSEIISDKLVGFANSSITLASVEKSTVKPTNINWYYRNRILNRHRNYLNTQWWNGQLNEHNTESTFSSEIDWRYNFVESIGDIFIDFPDAEQFYNSRNRRWNLTNRTWNHWFNFEKVTSQEIYNQFIFDCFIKAYTSLDKSREILDFYAFNSLNQSIIKEFKEISVITIFSRFS